MAAPGFRVVSWNLHGAPGAPDVRGRFGRAAGWILEARRARGAVGPPDLVLFQEVWTRGQEEILRDPLEAGYEIASTPPGWILPRKGGLLALVRRGGPLALLRSEFREFEAEAPQWRFWEADGLGDKGIQRLELRLGDHTFFAFHTHLQAAYARAPHAEVRAAQLGELARWASAAPRSAPLLVAGDLNTEPPELERLLLRRDPRWRDLTAPLRSRRECWSPPDESGREEWIDYILARGGDAQRFRVERSDCVPSRPADVPFSDHPGMDLDLALEAAHAGLRRLVPALAARLAEPQCRREWLGSAALLAVAAALRLPEEPAL